MGAYLESPKQDFKAKGPDLENDVNETETTMVLIFPNKLKFDSMFGLASECASPHKIENNSLYLF